MTHVLVTGGAGFIGSHLVEALLARPETSVTVLDKLTYAGSRENLAEYEDDPRYSFVLGDIADAATVEPLVAAADRVLHAAAESHVDRSIAGPREFLVTNVLGTYTVLEAAREAATPVLVVNTDEVYGAGDEGTMFGEEDRLLPRSPYAASKAAAELLAYAYRQTYGADVITVRGTNAYGPRQFPEKVIPVYTMAALEGRPLPVYAEGKQRREFLFVRDWVAACLTVLDSGEPGSSYNIGGGYELPNLDLARRVCSLAGAPEELISFVPDRPGHDFRYGLRWDRLAALGWKPEVPFDEGLARTVAWYDEHRDWVARMLSGARP
ncbi:MAG TPA: dTDP-glucose 4,6-dehydratase [Actinomycetota bacterium]|jgi:dTDP-glucose 4,6-dehydratase|nr:dTDP-glucose 4,6-dehydratase [Actinomycetota bacterium]